MHRRQLITAFTAGCASVGWSRCIEPRWFERSVTRVTIPRAGAIRILHASDIHMSDGLGARELGPALKWGLAAEPDLIRMTGDFVSSTDGFDESGLYRMLRRAADTAPCYAVLGNHDGGDWLVRYGGSPSTKLIRDLLTSAGVGLLHNRSAIQSGLTLVGVGDLWSGEFDSDRAFASLPPDAPTVVLCHNPDGKDAIASRPWDLMLSGHTHGGQCRIPGLTPAWAPVSDKRFIAGLYRWRDRQIFITRGLGSPTHVRAFCRPEISILDLTPQRGSMPTAGISFDAARRFNSL